MIWNVIDSINLYHTGIGLCDWQIHLCEEGILAIPEGIARTLKLAASVGLAAGVVGGTHGHAGYGSLSRVDTMMKHALGRRGERQIPDHGDAKWMRFPLAELEQIIVQARPPKWLHLLTSFTKEQLTGSYLFVRRRDGRKQRFATDNAPATAPGEATLGNDLLGVVSGREVHATGRAIGVESP